ncbi:hypothetical protein Hokovirus_1_210 [Hokovirus HKV1]|uniref:Uncharacterized protein n=1 Tax=Hokovirus HKV1 TaxID=1977638 RepID=A0A1V0SF73_9VIRU|nr:hypothetical protein Hokovirus_1_210 [Hokovirus HKV1]
MDNINNETPINDETPINNLTIVSNEIHNVKNMNNFRHNNNYEFIYLIHVRESLRLNENIYKIGKTKQKNMKRIVNYPKGSELLLYIECTNCDMIETILINLFKTKYILVSDYGNEYFKGSHINMIRDITNIVNYYNYKYSSEQEILNENIQETSSNNKTLIDSENVILDKNSIDPENITPNNNIALNNDNISFDSEIQEFMKINNNTVMDEYKFLKNSIKKNTKNTNNNEDIENMKNIKCKNTVKKNYNYCAFCDYEINDSYKFHRHNESLKHINNVKYGIIIENVVTPSKNNTSRDVMLRQHIITLGEKNKILSGKCKDFKQKLIQNTNVINELKNKIETLEINLSQAEDKKCKYFGQKLTQSTNEINELKNKINGFKKKNSELKNKIKLLEKNLSKEKDEKYEILKKMILKK